MIEIRHLKKVYEIATPFVDLNATVNDGDVVTVIGPSGTGKSTFIRCINRLETPTSGEIIVDGVCVTDKKCDLCAVRKKMGMVFQSFNLFGNMTVVENVMAPQTDLLKVDKQTAYDKAIELLKMVGLENKALQYPEMLSGGQKQRVAIARTLSTDPDIILLDEPTSALDPTTVGEVESIILKLAEMGKTMIIVTHDMKLARKVSNRIFYLDEGGLYEDGTPEEIFDHPKREKTRRFVRRFKVFESVLGEDGQDFLSILGEIEKYSISNRIPFEITDRIKALTEEMGVEILLAESGIDKVKIVLEFDDAKQSAFVQFLYGGKKFDPKETENQIAYKLLEKYYSTIKYFYHEREENPNEVLLHIK